MTVLLTVVVMLVALFRAAADVLFARPLASLMDRTRPGNSIKWFGVLLLIAGFHFDFLAS